MNVSRNADPGVGAAASAWSSSRSVIDADSHFNGIFRTSRDLHIEGDYEGEIHCDGVVTVAERARVAGTVTAGTVSVAGTLQGDVSCSGRFEIMPTGQVNARVAADAVIVHDGAFYEGDMRMLAEPAGLSPVERAPTVIEATPASQPARRETRDRSGSAGEAAIRNGRDEAAPERTAHESS